jgi:hypothetical protein
VTCHFGGKWKGCCEFFDFFLFVVLFVKRVDDEAHWKGGRGLTWAVVSRVGVSEVRSVQPSTGQSSVIHSKMARGVGRRGKVMKKAFSSSKLLHLTGEGLFLV